MIVHPNKKQILRTSQKNNDDSNKNNSCLILSTSSINNGVRNVGAYRIASFLRTHGWQCTVADYIDLWNTQDLRAYLKRHINEDTKWIGISFTWIPLSEDKEQSLAHIQDVIRFIKSIRPDILIIAGGMTPYENNLEVDYYVYGYAEKVILQILNYKFNKGPPIVFTNKFRGKFIDAIHTHPAYNLPTYEVQYQDDDFLSDKEPLIIEFSRGCKFQCDYCTFPFIGIKEDTSTSEENLYRELMTNYERWGIKTYQVADETINDRVEKLEKIRNVVKRLDFEPDFCAFTRIDLFRSHPEKIELMAESRIWGHFYGIETFNHASGKAVGKGQNPDYVKESLLKVKDYFLKYLGKYRGTASMIAGLPYESIDSMRQSHQWFLENWQDQSVIWNVLNIVNNGKLSAMGKDFTKYGYEFLDTWDGRKIDSHVLSGNTIVYWKNQYTNILEVEDIVKNEFQYEKIFHLCGLKLMRITPIIPYEQSKTIKLDFSTHLTIGSTLNDRVNNYIEKKKNS
jgi:hypothetical protein